MITVYIEKIPRGGYKFKWDISPVSFEVARFYDYSLRGTIREWRDCYGFKRKHVNFVEVN